MNLWTCVINDNIFPTNNNKKWREFFKIKFDYRKISADRNKWHVAIRFARSGCKKKYQWFKLFVCILVGTHDLNTNWQMKRPKKKFLRSSELMCNIGGVTLRHIHNVSIIIKQYSLRNKRMNECLCLTPKTFTTEAHRINIPKIGFCHFIDVYLVCLFRLQYNLQYAMQCASYALPSASGQRGEHFIFPLRIKTGLLLCIY